MTCSHDMWLVAHCRQMPFVLPPRAESGFVTRDRAIKQRETCPNACRGLSHLPPNAIINSRAWKQGEMAPPNKGSHVPDVLWLLHLPPNAIINPRTCGSRVVHTISRRQIKGGMPQMPCWNTRCILEGIHFAGGFWIWLRGVGTNRRPACKNTPVR
jgi:hypothetical protein